MTDFKYLHRHGPHTLWLDHRLTPEVRAMLCAMVSRMPVDGVTQRYSELVEAVATGFLDTVRGHLGDTSFLIQVNGRHGIPFSEKVEDGITYIKVHFHSEDSRWYPASEVQVAPEVAEDRLCEYPLHPKVQAFFDQFVRDYVHSTILELTGDPAVFVEGISWWTAWLLFDSPLVCGQEASTRAMDFSKREVCFESGFHLELMRLHDDWMEVYRAEVEAWKIEFAKKCLQCGGHGLNTPGGMIDGECYMCNGTGLHYPFMRDQQPFRPAFDRARWALPGTISTAVSMTSHVRERARVIRDGLALSRCSPTARMLWEEIAGCYKAACPGIGELGLREAVYSAESDPPRHLKVTRCDDDVEDVAVLVLEPVDTYVLPYREPGTYADPAYNEQRVRFDLGCSLAVARDWHRHRTAYPWELELQWTEGVGIAIDHHYTPISKIGKERTTDLLRRSSDLYEWFLNAGDKYSAMLCLPLGTRVALGSRSVGLRDLLYLL